jgi:hypothetical protein
MPETKVEEVAVENNIEASVSEVLESTDAITTADLSRSSSDQVQTLGSVVNGVIGVTHVQRQENNPVINVSNSEKPETVAVYSTRNVSLPGVGKVSRGYNLVPKKDSEHWLRRSHIRLATPEELAKEFGL